MHGNKGRKRPDLSERNKKNKIHGLWKTNIHHVWSSMFDRCNNEKHRFYSDYGGRGIKVCDRWSEIKGLGFINFLQDMGYPQKGMQLDRIDNNLGYSKSNCRWVTPKINCRNRRSAKMVEFNGQNKCLAQWAEDLGIERKTLQMRLKVWSIEKALTTPYTPRKEK